MKQIITLVVASALFLLMGFGLSRAGAIETRGIEADRALMTLGYEDAADSYKDIEDLTADAARMKVPWLEGLSAEARSGREAAEYWIAAAGGIAPSNLSPIVTANLATRAALAEKDRTALLNRLDAALKQYTDVLKARDDADAAFNYELVARLRTTFAASRQPGAKAAPVPAAPIVSIHGQSGAPPAATDMKQFKMFVPMMPDERKDVQPDAGKGSRKQRKG